MKISEDSSEITLEKGGEIAYIKVGNTVIDVMHGFNSPGETEPVAIINLYKYDRKKENKLLVYNEKDIILAL